MWSERRKADKTALVSLHGNSYQVDAWLAGRMRRAGLRPVRPGPASRSGSRASPPGPPSRSPSAGTATPRPAPPTGRPRAEPAPTGIDYLAALGDGHDAGLKEQVSYRFLVDGGQEGDRKAGGRP